MPLQCNLWKKLHCPIFIHPRWKPALVLLVVLDLQVSCGCGCPPREREVAAGLEEHSSSVTLSEHFPVDNFSKSSAPLTSTES